MSAPIASETRRPFRARSEIRACSDAAPRPAATRSALLRCGRGRRHGARSPGEDGVRGRPGRQDQAFLFGVAVKAGDGAQGPGDGGPGRCLFQRPGVELDIGAMGREQLEVLAPAPGHKLPKVQGRRRPG